MVDTDFFRPLAHPPSAAFFERLCRREMSVSELKAGFEISQPAVSQHLAALRGAGLVCERREGRFAYYRAEPQGLKALIDWVDRYRQYWPERLEKLKNVLKDMEP